MYLKPHCLRNPRHPLPPPPPPRKSCPGRANFPLICLKNLPNCLHKDCELVFRRRDNSEGESFRLAKYCDHVNGAYGLTVPLIRFLSVGLVFILRLILLLLLQPGTPSSFQLPKEHLPTSSSGTLQI